MEWGSRLGSQLQWCGRRDIPLPACQGISHPLHHSSSKHRCTTCVHLHLLGPKKKRKTYLESFYFKSRHFDERKRKESEFYLTSIDVETSLTVNFKIVWILQLCFKRSSLCFAFNRKNLSRVLPYPFLHLWSLRKDRRSCPCRFLWVPADVVAIHSCRTQCDLLADLHRVTTPWKCKWRRLSHWSRLSFSQLYSFRVALQ